MTRERLDRATEVKNRYLANIYRTRRSQGDRKRIRKALEEGGEALARAMDDILSRKYERTTYMGNIKG